MYLLPLPRIKRDTTTGFCLYIQYKSNWTELNVTLCTVHNLYHILLHKTKHLEKDRRTMIYEYIPKPSIRYITFFLSPVLFWPSSMARTVPMIFSRLNQVRWWFTKPKWTFISPTPRRYKLKIAIITLMISSTLACKPIREYITSFPSSISID